jgi:MFS family permease
MIVSLASGGLLRADSHWLLPATLIIVGAMTNGIFNPANSTAMISMMPREHRGFASAMNHVTFGFGNVFGVALGGLCMSLAFEFHTGIKAAALTAEKIRPASWRRSIPLFSRLLYCASQECSHQLCAVRPSQPETKKIDACA